MKRRKKSKTVSKQKLIKPKAAKRAATQAEVKRPRGRPRKVVNSEKIEKSKPQPSSSVLSTMTKPTRPSKSRIKKAVKKVTAKAVKKASLKIKKQEIKLAGSKERVTRKIKSKAAIAAGKDANPKFVIKTCKFVEASDLVPPQWTTWFWCCISENAPFSWGDNSHSLVYASDFAEHCKDRLESQSNISSMTGVKSSDITMFISKLQSLENTYIDLEN